MSHIFHFFSNMLYSQFLVTPPSPTTDCTGKTFIVTGANVGLGKEAARHFVRLNAAKVVLACRNVSKGNEAKEEIEKSQGRSGVCEVWALDLGDYGSVRKFAERVKGLERIDAVVENAGVMTYKYTEIGGNESTITVNVVSTFLLALLLLPKLREVGQKFGFTPTLSIVSSEMHFATTFPERHASSIFDQLRNASEARMTDRYQVSKLLEVLAVREIAREHPYPSMGVTLNTLTPGWCHSELGREIKNPVLSIIMRIFCRTTEVGSRTLVIAALSGRDTHGQYMMDGRVHRCSPLVEGKEGPELQRRVWTELAQLLEKIEPGVTANLDG